MKNQYMTAQCQNMISVINAFSKACELAALEDDGTVSKAEEKALRNIRSAARRFQKELQKAID